MNARQPLLATAAWRPILEGSQRDQAVARIETVLEALAPVSPVDPAKDDPTLAGGHAGRAVVLVYASRALARPDLLDIARIHMDAATSALTERDLPPSLFSGFGGIAWAYAHCEQAIYGDTDPGALGEIDELVLHLLRRRRWPLEYDLMNGLVGLGVYALERLPDAMAAEALERVVAHLGDLSTVSPDGIYWHTPALLLPRSEREKYPDGWTNLGVSHGIPAAIALLAGIAGAGVAVDAALHLLDGAVDWMWAHRLTPESGGCFATLVDGYHPNTPSRPAWCYGDVGIAGALAAAAGAVNHPRLAELAFQAARAAAMRDPADPDVVDGGLCHGWTGVAHVFNRLFHATGEESFLRAARAWFARTLEGAREGEGVGGYRAWALLPGGEFGWAPDSGLLTGAAGILAPLLGAITPAAPEWDRVLMLSFPNVWAGHDRT